MTLHELACMSPELRSRSSLMAVMPEPAGAVPTRVPPCSTAQQGLCHAVLTQPHSAASSTAQHQRQRMHLGWEVAMSTGVQK